MRHNILHIILTLSIALLALQSCGLEEPVGGGINGGSGIEVVFRPTSYEGVYVKSTTNTDPLQIENKIYTAEMLVFDNNGNRTIRKTLTTSNGALTNQSSTFTDDPLFNEATVCFIANVPSDFVDTWSKKLDTDTAYESDLDKFHSAVLDFTATGSKFSYATDAGCIGVPQVKLYDNSNPVKCFPMYGEISLANRTSNQITIDIKRLFAKVEIVVSVGTAVTKFTMESYTVHNLPTKVGLCEPAEGESLCAKSTTNADFLSSHNSMSSFNLTGSSDNVIKTGTKSFYFYMPEHVLGGDKTNENVTNPTQSDKPNIIGTSYKPTYVSIVGEVIANGSNNIVNFCDHTYNIYLGGNEINNYDVARNYRYENNVTINGITADNRIPNPVVVPYTNLVNGEAANCYIITTSNKNYLLPTYIGATKNLVESNMVYGIPEVIWNDNPENVIELINDDIADRQITFKVTNSTNPTSSAVKPGNALIAIRDPETEEILWSWHLWFCANGVPNDQYYAANTYLMDRSLGAKESANLDLSFLGALTDTEALHFFYKDGLFYQRGRKDPLKKPELAEYKFVNQDDITKEQLTQNLGGDLDDTNSNPWVFDKGWSFKSSWAPQNNVKSTYDPCPAGYRVPSSDVWTKKEEDFSRLNANESTFIYTSLDDINISNWRDATIITYPYAGYMDTDGVWNSGVTGEGVATGTTGDKEEDAALYPSTISINFIIYNLQIQGNAGYHDKNAPKPKRIRSINYTVVDKQELGYLSSIDSEQNSVKYGYKDQGIQIISYYLEEGEWKDDKKMGIKYHKAEYKDAGNTYTIEQRPLESGELEQVTKVIQSEITRSSIFGDGWTNVLSNIFNKVQDLWTSNAIFEKETDTSKAAYNVRCIRE